MRAPLVASAFKIYRGHVKIGPLTQDLVCVVGPNGAGKSIVVSNLHGVTASA